MLRLVLNRAVRFIDWLGGTVTNERLVHCKPAEVWASTLDTLLGVELKAVTIKKWAGRETCVRCDGRSLHGKQRRFDTMVEPAGNAATSECRMSKQEVEVTAVGVRGETGNKTISLSNDGVKACETLPPAALVWRNRCPRRKLLR